MMEQQAVKVKVVARQECPGCHIKTGEMNEEGCLVDYRGRLLCSWCVANWKTKEARAGRKLPFIEYRREPVDITQINALAEMKKRKKEKASSKTSGTELGVGEKASSSVKAE
ncbi:hypothetical protein LCGC14_0787880 [marine sediment metagenome]|uniref:Uncharacterized protein n=1 Tax=marine sediment metagenome TaxID=412755 RepID=A0A0F9PXT4_9ZZZZ